MINFRLAELRKKSNLTQQELGDILNVSYQTISKWENNVAYPDITVLPQISSYFGVSVDALLGLVPLDHAYQPSDAGRAGYWEKRLEYLKRTRKTMWNEDYLQFLIEKVWKIDKPVSVLDCGCGYGFMQMLMMPLLPKGSRYTGIDFSQTMIDAAKDNYLRFDNAKTVENDIRSGETTFILADILEYEPKEKYDLVISQAILRHVDDAEKFLRRMVSFVKPEGLLVVVDCNREFEADGTYIQGMDYMKLCRHDGLKKMWQTELEQQNRDYSVAMKVPHYMKAAGLKNVACRMNDRVNFVEPQQLDYDELMECRIKADLWEKEKTDKELDENIAYFMNHGMSRKEAEDYCRQQNGIARFLKENKGNVAMTAVGGLMITYGWKN